MENLAEELMDAHACTRALVGDLSDEQVMGPRLATVNPLRWEVGHVAWFHEKWVLRDQAGQPPRLAGADALYDSSAVPHDTRWDLPLPSWSETLAFLDEVLQRRLDRVARGPGELERYFLRLGLHHEAMHDEAFVYTRQTLGYPAPSLPRVELGERADTGPLEGDARVPGGRFLLGAVPGEPFVFDNEKWAHPVDVAPFAIARAPVTQAEFAAFVDDDGYRHFDLPSAQPVYWRKENGRWQRRDFARWVPLEPHRPMLHVSWHEASAYCRWAGRRLPTELEWEVAAAGEPLVGRLATRKRRFPWGDAPPTAARANLDGRHGGCLDVAALADGDSAFGCRQMLGNVWEWTASEFQPYPGFVVDPYRDYSQPWFGTHKVLRGGCWATPARLLRNTWRNFYPPDRRDVWAGFRTCAP